jgi:hypothetical protein
MELVDLNERMWWSIYTTVVNLSACSASAVWVCFPNIVRRYDLLGAYSALHRGGLACGFALDRSEHIRRLD